MSIENLHKHQEQTPEQTPEHNYTYQQVTEALAKFKSYHGAGAENGDAVLNTYFATLSNFAEILNLFNDSELDELKDDLKSIQEELEKYKKISTESELENYIAQESQRILEKIRDGIIAEIQKRVSDIQDT